MRGKPKINQPVVLKHVKDPVVMHIEEITSEGDKCKCVWHDRVGAPYRAEFNTDVLEAYKETRAQENEGGKLALVKAN
jgi:uncharacterized protein YodC (DUF2158 family)